METAVSKIASTFFLCFAAPNIGAAAGLDSGFFGLAVFLVAVTLGCLGASVTDWGEDFYFGWIGGSLD